MIVLLPNMLKLDVKIRWIVKKLTGHAISAVHSMSV